MRIVACWRFAWTFVSVLLALPSVAPAEENRGEAVDFAHDIRPIFAKRCFSCHGPDSAEASLRLDRKADAFRGGNSGPAFEAGKSAQSRLVKYVTTQDEEETMMPPDGERLSTTEVALIRRWIDQGATWPEESTLASQRGANHWSFQPIKRVSPPAVRNIRWVRNPIDQFVLARLEALGVEPSPEADRPTLLRRLSLDLLGLPPTPAEVQEFVDDKRPDAYERLVDRLLASPHYGERFARHWLDLARYADSDGYEKDTGRPFAWRYRNWVIDAFNRDLRFDQFTIDQLAGDLLPNATTEQRVATGFHRNTLTNKEGGVDQEEFRVAATVDRTNTTGSVWLGLTVGCAQCHSHKYDPISQREYYSLFAFFNGLQETNIPAPFDEQVTKYRQAMEVFRREHEPLVAAVREFEKDEQPSRQAAWEDAWKKQPGTAWTTLDPEQVTASGKGALVKQANGSVLAQAAEGVGQTYTFTSTTPLPNLRAIRLEVLAHPKLPKLGPGRGEDGSFMLSEFAVTVAPADPKHPQAKQAAAKVKLQNALADVPATGAAGIDNVLDGKPETAWSITPPAGQDHVATFETIDCPQYAGGTRITITLAHQVKRQAAIGCFRISVTDAVPPLKTLGISNSIVEALNIPSEKRTATQRASIAGYYHSQDDWWRKLSLAVTEHARRAPVDPGTLNQAQALVELAGGRKTHVLMRGDFLRPGAEVQPTTLEVLPPLKPHGKQPDRIDLARWLVDPSNPLVPRVAVNRFWAWHFGRGLVATVEDFGTQGEKPSHAELLDWLAGEFVRQRWSMKALHKLIVTSATYRQTSRVRPELVDRDANNVWLARQRRLRVEAEVIRDVALAASGALCETIGGPSVRPRQPAGVSELTYAGAAKWIESQGDDRHRRGLYTWFQRTSPYPMLMTFDAPDSNVTCTRRERSNTPLQALTLLNDPVFFECAQKLGRRIVHEAPRTGDSAQQRDARLDYAFVVCLGRKPTSSERTALGQLFDSQLALCQSDSKSAEELVGSDPRPEGASAAELAAWIVVGRTLMNLDEFITRE